MPDQSVDITKLAEAVAALSEAVRHLAHRVAWLSGMAREQDRCTTAYQQTGRRGGNL